MAGPWEMFQKPAQQPQPEPVQTAPEQGPWSMFQGQAPEVLIQQANMSGFQSPNEDIPRPDDSQVQGVWGRLIQQESGGNQNAVSPKGAIGRAQLMPKTAPEAAALAGLPFDEQAYKTNPQYNEALGQAYLRKQFQDFGDERLALAAYNAGPGRVRETIDRLGDPRTGQVTWNGFMAGLPAETRDYVKNISGDQDEGIKVPEWVKETGRVIDAGVKGGLKSVGTLGTTLVRGTEEIARYPAELAANAAGTSIDEILAPIQKYFPEQTPAQLAQSGVEYLTHPIEQPQTQTGQMASNVIGSTVAGALTPGIGMVPGAVQGLGAGIGAETAAQVLGESPFSRVAGSLVGGGLAAGTQALLPSAAKGRLASEVTSQMDDYGLQLAKQNMEDAQKLGVTLTLDQAYPTSTNAQKLTEIFSNMKGGEQLASTIRQQPQQIVNAAKDLQKTLPGQVLPASQVNAQAQKEATNVLNQDTSWRTSEVKPYYAASGDISANHGRKIIADLKQLVANNPGTTKGTLIEGLLNKLQVTKPVYKDGVKIGERSFPLLNMDQINGVLRSEQTAAKNINVSSAAGDKEAVGLLNRVATDLRDEMGQVSPEFAKGNKLYGQISESLVNPNRASAIGQVAGTQGYNSAKTSPEVITSVFDRGTPIDPKTGKAVYSDILGLQSQLARTGQKGNEAFMNAGASWIGEKFGRALGSSSAAAPKNVSRRIDNEFFSSDKDIQGLKDVVSGMAKSAGEDSKPMVDGLNTFIKTVQRAATTSPQTRGATAGEVRGVTGAPGIEQVGKFIALQPFRQPMLFLQAKLNKSAVETVSKLMTTPEGIATLKQLAKTREGSQAAYKILSQFSSTLSETDNQPETP